MRPQQAEAEALPKVAIEDQPGIDQLRSRHTFLPPMKIVMNFFLRSRLARVSAADNFRLAMIEPVVS